ncbi:MAG: hypothetical protein MUF34_15330 [Polyangiaceae bacterium]|jgi:hypothetical protein|nr:hypothetical protein [Polyangiaceae bacterium]
MRPFRRATACAAASLAALCATSAALAQPSPGDRAFAEGLFREARELLAQGSFAVACPKFAESYRLDPALGTLLNLAICHERQGRVTTAWIEYKEAVSEAQRTNQKSRLEYARSRVKKLEPKLAFVVVNVAEPVEGLEIKLGAATVGQAAWGSPLPVDPGEQPLRALAPGHKAWVSTVRVGEPGSRTEVRVPALEVEPAPTAASPLPTEPAPTPLIAPRPASSPPLQAPAPVRASSSPLRTVGFVVGGVGLVGLGVSAGFGLRALSLKSKRDGNCESATICNADGLGYDADARDAARISTIAFAAGAALTAAGVTLLVLAPSRPAQAARLELRPAPGGLALGGAF